MTDSLDLSCIGCHKRMSRYRGLCPSCYEQQRRRVAKGEATWTQLEEEGKARKSSGKRWNHRYDYYRDRETRQ